MTTQKQYDRITFSLPHSMNVTLDALKDELKSSKSDIIKQAIEYFVQKQEEEKLSRAVELMANEYANNDELTAYRPGFRGFPMKQGSIWQVNLDPTIGSEIKKSRPCIILSNDQIGKLPLKIIAPLTDFKENYALVPWMVTVEPTKENGLSKKSVIDLFQVRSVSQQRLTHKTGEVQPDILMQCQEALDIVFKL